ncbi:hypothetical protein JB92DRAFT_1948078 [Gautieria morchelliformis]|nr:hypothetical protein JB92DRAFT_1948078 [Gautieria morchelliformis]
MMKARLKLPGGHNVQPIEMRPSHQVQMGKCLQPIRPGEIMPMDAIRPIMGPPSFFPPMEAPPFPPTVHAPIRPAHFPPSLHPTPENPELARAPSHHQPPMPQAPQPSRSHSHTSSPARTPSHDQRPIPQAPQPTRSHSYHSHQTSPSPHQPVHPVPPSLTPAHSHGQPPRELLRSQSQSVIPHPPPPQPIRAHSDQNTRPPHPLQQEYTNTPPPSRRHTFIAREGVPPGLAPNGRYTVPQPPPPVPHHQAPPPGPPSRSQSQHQPHHHTLPRSALRDTRHQSLAAPAPLPSHVQFAAPVPAPVRLPSENIRTPQALGIAHSPPTSSGSPRPDNSRPPRLTPKPVMPPLLAPLVVQEPNLGRVGPGQLQRSASSAVIGAEKGGFLAKTKSILRKRSSGIRTHADGAISFAPTMPNLTEENSAESKKLAKRLSRKK